MVFSIPTTYICAVVCSLYVAVRGGERRGVCETSRPRPFGDGGEPKKYFHLQREAHHLESSSLCVKVRPPKYTPEDIHLEKCSKVAYKCVILPTEIIFMYLNTDPGPIDEYENSDSRFS